MTAALATRLRRLDPAVARTQTALLAALHGLRAGDSVIEARAADDKAPATAVRFESWIGPISLSLAGASDSIAAAQSLARVEPLLQAVERALRIELAPAGFESAHAPSPVSLTLRWAGEELRLSVRADAPLAPASNPPPPLSPALAAAAIPCRVQLEAPALTPAALAAIAPGDLALIPARPQARLTFNLSAFTVALDLASLKLTVTAAEPRLQETRLDSLAPSTDPADSAPADLTPDLANTPLPVTIALDSVTAPLGRIAALRPGSVLDLAAGPGGSLPARLEVGGRTIATGELVAVGDAYGFLVAQVA